MDFFNDLQAYFSGLTQEQWWYVLSMLVLAFILGLLIAYILRGFTVRRYRKALLMAERSRADYEAQYLAANEKQKKLAAELAANSQAKIAAMDEAEDLRAQLNAHRDVAVNLQNQLAQSEATVASLTATIEEQKNQIASLQSQNEALSLISTTTPAVEPQSPSSSTDSPLESRLEALEARLAAMGTTATSTTDTSTTNSGYHQPVIEQLPVMDEAEEEPIVIRADTTNPGIREGEAGQTEVIVDTSDTRQVELIQIPDDNDRDDLQKIKNIGPFLEEKLNEQGIFSYRQIAGWDDVDIERMTTDLGYLPGRIATDDWVGQAQSFASTVVAIPTEKPPKGFRPDNLKLMEGIGPKIEGILKENGIKDLADLAATSVDDLKAILIQAGNRYRIHDPSSWPQQAALARDGQWADLKALQDAK